MSLSRVGEVPSLVGRRNRRKILFAFDGFLPAKLAAEALLRASEGGGRPGIWPIYVWIPVVFLASVYAVVAGMRGMADPRLRTVSALAVLAILAFFSFPLFWLPG